MANSYWFIVSFTEYACREAYHIVLTTDVPCHLWMRLSFNAPQTHPRARIFRGLAVMGDVYYCFTAYKDIEQEEAGDTLTHTFTVSSWEAEQIRWFYFHGEVGGEASPSTSCIFGRQLYYTLHSFDTTITTPNLLANRFSGVWTVGPDAPPQRLTVGRWMRAAMIQGGAMRFINVTVPKCAEVLLAHLYLTSWDNNAFPSVHSRISAELTPDAAILDYITWGEFGVRYATRTGIVNWDEIEPWVTDGIYQSPNFANTLTAIFGQAAWESGNAILIFWEDFDRRTPWSASFYRWACAYFYTPTKAPRLFVTYNHWQVREVIR